MENSYSDTSVSVKERNVKERTGDNKKVFSKDPVRKDDHRLQNLTDRQLQKYLLDGVSRTFALTIQQLPEKLIREVSNAYLLCRIIDTIEDEPFLGYSEKKRFCEFFVRVVEGQSKPEVFAEALYPNLSEKTSDSEKELIRLTPKVIRIKNSFQKSQQEALEQCVRKMSEGMVYYQGKVSTAGLHDLDEIEEYCYFVAGVVGEMLTKLFCMYSPEIARNKNEMMSLGVSFGKGLQMTNILKDLWKDYDDSICWLPRSIFDEYGYDLKNLELRTSAEEFQKGIFRLIGIAHKHLENAVSYTLLIPEKETGIRKFCLWAIGMAVLTLRKINNNIDYTNSDQVKITRNSVKATIISTNLCIKNNFMLELLFDLSRKGLPYPED